MSDQDQRSYSDLCHLLGSAIGKAEMTSEGARTWTFTPKMKSPPWPLWCSALPAEIQIEIFRSMVLARLRAAGFVEV